MLAFNHKKYKQFSKRILGVLLDETFLNHWDFDATTKALIGDDIFNSII